MPDGEYNLGGRPVVVSGGAARLRSGGALAGSTLTMDAAVRRMVRSGVPVPRAIQAATSTPASAVGLARHCGTLPTGMRPDLIVLNEALKVAAVLSGT
jgi:N-acetylglucosamine-6-phosphate deacetylase